MADNELYAGSLAAFADSMAAEIEGAYDEVLAEAGKDPLPEAGQQDRRILFTAIARGVIYHLAKKHAALTVTVPVNPTGQPIAVDVKVK
jgi:hypothetical protein